MDGLDRSRKAAADWVVRLSDPGVTGDDWLAFEAWLRAAPDHRQAYDEYLMLWAELGALASFAAEGGVEPARGPIAAPSTWWAAGAVAALAMIAVSSGVYLRPAADRAEAAPAVYATQRGQQLAVQLADGTQIDLGGASRIAVRFDGDHRDVTMLNGEAAFKVTHDPRRPFTVAVGDRRIEDIGTEFDIRRGPTDVAVTVREGLVQVGPAAGGAGGVVSVSPGHRLRHTDGARSSVVEDVTADDIFAWKAGRLVYRDQPLRVVAEDLNRYLPHALTIQGPETGELHFTGVLTVDSEAPTLNRLTALLPVSAKASNGAIIISLREDAR